MSGPHDTPTAAELVAAVREWLADTVDTNEPPHRFHTRVAANVLVMVEREIELGPEHAAAHEQRLRRLGVDTDTALAAAIRSGVIDYRDDQVRELVWASVRDKLAVANPRYVERASDPGD